MQSYVQKQSVSGAITSLLTVLVNCGTLRRDKATIWRVSRLNVSCVTLFKSCQEWQEDQATLVGQSHAVPTRLCEQIVHCDTAKPVVGVRLQLCLDAARVYLCCVVIDTFANKIAGWRASR